MFFFLVQLLSNFYYTPQTVGRKGIKVDFGMTWRMATKSTNVVD